MPRIIVTTDPSQLSADVPVLLDEHVHSVHLSTGHAAAQLVERIAWAISDAENVEGTGEPRVLTPRQRYAANRERSRAAQHAGSPTQSRPHRGVGSRSHPSRDSRD
jgi:hypothetical protein